MSFQSIFTSNALLFSSALVKAAPKNRSLGSKISLLFPPHSMHNNVQSSFPALKSSQSKRFFSKSFAVSQTASFRTPIFPSYNTNSCSKISTFNSYSLLSKNFITNGTLPRHNFKAMITSRLYSNKTPQNAPPNPEPNPAKKQSKLSSIFSQYGRIAVFLYLAISSIDLPLSILLVYFSGENFTNYALDLITKYFPSLTSSIPQGDVQDQAASSLLSYFEPKTIVILVTGYAIHKLLLPIRVALTAAWCPSFSKLAAKNGWNLLLSKKSTLKKN
ncbi:N-terminal acetyltransferase 2 [Smittium culicis]|uniref:N-terminal acetyltransferase 2 n=1 Tax=Smittium culicis TaxID=133412 RepID=A0A1R1X9L4_9FUNG|nr:N-terminal acetyltransferase 2 [Smittium culicis]OMJ23487.1 N-terminal acetyltransferase 2 [Smittium culicis]